MRNRQRPSEYQKKLVCPTVPKAQTPNELTSDDHGALVAHYRLHPLVTKDGPLKTNKYSIFILPFMWPFFCDALSTARDF